MYSGLFFDIYSIMITEEYDDGYDDRYNTNAEFSVEVKYKKVTLSPIGIQCLAIECYASAYSNNKTSSTHYFRVESDAMEFVEIVNLHSVKNIQPK